MIDSVIVIVIVIKFENKRVTNNSILMKPTENEPQFYIIKKIIIVNNEEIFLISQNLHDCYFNEHTQSFNVIVDNPYSWKIFTYPDLECCTITYFNILNKQIHITKLWT